MAIDIRGEIECGEGRERERETERVIKNRLDIIWKNHSTFTAILLFRIMVIYLAPPMHYT
jgi:hypothetical protein